MSINKKDVEKVAELARLALTEEEKEVYTNQLGRILEHVEKLSGVDTKGVEPTTFTVPLRKATREDVTKSSLSNDAALKNAPSAEKGCFKVPQVIE